MAQLTLKCNKGHTLSSATCNRAVREIECDLCSEELLNGDDFFQCRKCVYDVCSGCFKRHASKTGGGGGPGGVSVADRVGSVEARAKSLSSVEMQSIRELPAEELHARLAGLGADQLRKLCGFVGTGQRGDKQGMQTRISEKILTERPDDHTKEPIGSPEGPGGRHRRSPRKGAAASTVRASVASCEVSAGQAAIADDRVRTRAPTLANSPTVATFLGETAASEDLPAVASLPGFVPVLDKKAAGANVVLAQLTAKNAVIVTEVSAAEINAAQDLVDDSFADSGGGCTALTSAAPVSMLIDDDDDDSISEASDVQGDVSLTDVMRSIKSIEKHQKASHKKIREVTRIAVAEAVNPIWDQLRTTENTVTELSKSAIVHDDRIGKLETRMSALSVGSASDARSKPDPNDPARLRLAFKGFEDVKTEALTQRVKILTDFMAANFTDEYYACVDTREEGAVGHKKPTNESYVQFFTPEARDRVLQQVKDKSIKCTNSKGKQLEILRAKTAWQRSRNWAMRASEKLIKDKLAANKITNIKVEYKADKDSRRILANGSPAFVQMRDEQRGQFTGDFQDLVLPP